MAAPRRPLPRGTQDRRLPAHAPKGGELATKALVRLPENRPDRDTPRERGELHPIVHTSARRPETLAKHRAALASQQLEGLVAERAARGLGPAVEHARPRPEPRFHSELARAKAELQVLGVHEDPLVERPEPPQGLGAGHQTAAVGPAHANRPLRVPGLEPPAKRLGKSARRQYRVEHV